MHWANGRTLRKSHTRHVDLNGFDAATSWRSLTEYGRTREEGPVVRATEHSSKGLSLYLDSVGYFAALENAQNLASPPGEATQMAPSASRQIPSGVVRAKSS